MSLYHFAEPAATAQFRENTGKQKSMGGIYYQQKRCSRCNDYKPLLGSTRVDGKFVCGDCKNAGARYFGPMLLGTLPIPMAPNSKPKPKARDRMTEYLDRLSSDGRDARRKNAEKLLAALRSGIYGKAALCEAANLSESVIQPLLTELVDEKLAERVHIGRGRHEWRPI